MGRSEHTLRTQDECCTPPEIWQRVVDALGPIAFDPCGHPLQSVPALSRVLLPKYFEAKAIYERDASLGPPVPNEIVRVQTGMPDGWHDAGDHDRLYADSLTLSWKGCGLVWLQPPYSKLPKQPWIAKGRDDTDECAGLLPVRTATQWWQRELVYYDVILFLEERVTHENTFDRKGVPTDDPAPFGQALVYNGPRAGLFVEAFADMGWRVLGAKR